MQLIFIYGQVASGKLAVARELAALTHIPLFHNHLVVDAVGAVFAFGSVPFVRLREEFWLRVIGEAAARNQSLIFTFAPEPTVDPDFSARVRAIVERAGGAILFVALEVAPDEQERRLIEPGRAEFGKLRSLDLLRRLRPDFARCMSRMPPADLVIDTSSMPPPAAASLIAARILA